jgi:hypothetical protein
VGNRQGNDRDPRALSADHERKIEADQEVKTVFNDKVKIICWGKKTMQRQKRSSQRIEKAQRWSKI